MAYVSLDYIKSHVRPDETESEEYLLGLANTAESYLGRNGVTPDTVDPAEYTLAVCSMVLFWYDHRSDPSIATYGGFDSATRWLINNLKNSAAVSNLDTRC